jgi:hypothetical protein
MVLVDFKKHRRPPRLAVFATTLRPTLVAKVFPLRLIVAPFNGDTSYAFSPSNLRRLTGMGTPYLTQHDSCLES